MLLMILVYALLVACVLFLCHQRADLDELKKDVRQHLRHVISLLQRDNIEYFLYSETLLGAVTEGDVLCGSREGHICVLQKDLAKVQLKLYSDYTKIKHAPSGRIMLISVPNPDKPYISVCIYVLDYDYGKDILGSRLWEDVNNKVQMPASLALPTKQMELPIMAPVGSTLVSVPSNPEGLLAYLYGRCWRDARCRTGHNVLSLIWLGFQQIK
jgi:hypothetical protein